MKTALISLLILSVFSIEALAKNCRNSQPCGNSCISWNKTCRIGTGSTYKAPAAKVPAARTAPALAAPVHSSATGSTYHGASTVMPTTDAAFIMDAPSRSANRIRRLRMDDEFSVYQRLNGWVRVSQDGKSAEWILGIYLTP